MSFEENELIRKENHAVPASESVPEETVSPRTPDGSDDKELLRKTRRARNISLIMILLAAVAVVVAVILAKDIIPKGVTAFKSAYNEAKSKAQEEMEQEYYDDGYDDGKTGYTDIKTVGIDIGSLREMSELVVLTVSDTEISIVNTDDNKDGIASWAKMTGHADYTVDMTKAEFIVDTARGSITVRITEPELGPVTPDYSTKDQLLLENKWFNDSIADGTAISEQQSAELKAQIEAALSSNESNAEFAREQAPTVVKNLLLDLNPGLDSEDITVEYFS